MVKREGAGMAMEHKTKRLKRYGFNTDNDVYIIAEIGINHNGNADTAKRLIDSACRAGVDAVKFQTYITEKRVKKSSPIFDILKKCELPFRAFRELKERAGQYGVEFFSTPFDEESVDCLESIGCTIYKVASFDVVNHKLLRKISDTAKTVVMSVGMSDLAEIKKAVKILTRKTDKMAILHCVSAYPTMEEDADMSSIYRLKREFDCVIGQSDHTNDIYVPLCAIAAGAQIIEKHFKIDGAMECVDKAVSITEGQMKELIGGARRIERILGNGRLGLRDAESGSKMFRRHSK